VKIGPNDMILIEPSDVAARPEPDAFRDPVVKDAVHRTFTWAMDFLLNPHPQLGRAGPVCPFTRESVDKSLFWMAYHRGMPTVDEVRDIMLGYRDWFLELEPREGRDAWLKTLLVLFVDLDVEGAQAILDKAHPGLSPEFTTAGLVMGPFHAGSEQPGIWNPHFRPLRSPVPFLVFRHMLVTDFPLVKDSQVALTEYLRRFAQVPIA
jgi:hypothetical protein